MLGLRKAHEDIANVMLHYLLKLIGSPDLNVISVWGANIKVREYHNCRGLCQSIKIEIVSHIKFQCLSIFNLTPYTTKNEHNIKDWMGLAITGNTIFTDGLILLIRI